MELKLNQGATMGLIVASFMGAMAVIGYGDTSTADNVKAESEGRVACFNAFAQTDKFKTGNFQISYDHTTAWGGGSKCELVPK